MENTRETETPVGDDLQAMVALARWVMYESHLLEMLTPAGLTLHEARVAMNGEVN